MLCKKNRTNLRRIVTVLLTLVLLVGTVGIASADTKSDINDQIAALEKEQEQLKTKISSLKQDAAEKQAYKNALDAQIRATQKQIDTYVAAIRQTDAEIAAAAAAIEAKNAELATLKKSFKARLRSICMKGGDTAGAAITVLMGAEDFGDVLTMAEYTKNTSAFDTMVMDNIAEAVRTIHAEQEALEAKRADLQAYQSELNGKKAALDAQVAEINAVLKELGQSTSQYNNSLAELEARQNALESQLAEILRREAEEQRRKQQQGAGDVPIFSSGFIWPLPGGKSAYWISSEFSYARPHPIYGTVRAHTGTDYVCSGIYGKPIYAAASGTVSIASYDDGGYGYFVMINHGLKGSDSYATLYAHMTHYVVSVGQTVSQGQVIGYVGESGAATGPHLHLEVRINGTAINPDPYFS